MGKVVKFSKPCKCGHSLLYHFVCGCCKKCLCTRNCNDQYFIWHATHGPQPIGGYNPVAIEIVKL